MKVFEATLKPSLHLFEAKFYESLNMVKGRCVYVKAFSDNIM